MKLIRFYIMISFITCFVLLLSGLCYCQTNVSIMTDNVEYYYEDNNNIDTNVTVPATEEKDKNITDKKFKKELGYFDYLWKSALFPGFGQYALGRKIKAVFFYSSFIASASLGLYFHFKAEDTYYKYRNEKEDRKKITELYEDYIQENQMGNTFFYITLGIWVYNIFDIIIDIRWINNNLTKDNKVAIDFNKKKVYFYVYKKAF